MSDTERWQSIAEELHRFIVDELDEDPIDNLAAYVTGDNYTFAVGVYGAPDVEDEDEDEEAEEVA